MKNIIIFLFTILNSFLILFNVSAIDDVQVELFENGKHNQIEEYVHEKSTSFTSSTDETVLVFFELQSKTLFDVIIALSEIKKINILIPASLEAEKIIINFSTKNQIPLEEVEEYLIYFLSMAGYILTLQDDIYVVTKKNVPDHVRRYNLPLYVNIKPEDLPDNVGYIRTINFLKHAKVPTPNGLGSEAIKQILFFLLPDKADAIMVDPRTNSLILTGPSNAIASVLLLIDEIDRFGKQDYVHYLPIEHIGVGYIQKLLEDILNLSKESNPVNPNNINAYAGPSYFSPQIKIVSDIKNNALMFLGEKEAIKKIINFIKTEIDVPEEHGKSLIHVYELKFLDSKKIASILQELVNGSSTSGSDQSVKDGNLKNNIYRKFDNVRIIPEEVLPAKRNTITGNIPTKLTLGGNKLIIAATEEDYQQLKQIIFNLDQPQPQVIIEIVILDIQYDETRNIASDSRLPSIINLPDGAQMQSLMWDNSQVILNNPGSGLATAANKITPGTTMNADILSGITSADGGDGKLTSLVNNSARNGLIISLGDKYKDWSIWSILQLEESVAKRNVIENPTIITQNNTPAKIQNIVVKRGAGELSPNNTQYGGATVVNIVSYTASLAIHITPRISFGSCGTLNGPRLNLEINMAIEDFKNSAQNEFTKYNRALKTNANVNSGDLLVLGGLHQKGETSTIAKVPFLGDLPLVGALFRKTVKRESDSNLIVIIRATIVEDNDALEAYTSHQTNGLQSELEENVLSQYRKEINHILP